MHVYSRGYPLPNRDCMTHLFYSWLKIIIVVLEIVTVEYETEGNGAALDSDDEGIASNTQEVIIAANRCTVT